ncbi:MAG: peptidylprolyl isomerase [Clostridia bacterium]|nr:peptidylprolyl isomerase [Clostridia bacterium]
MAKSAGANKRNDENKIGIGIKLTFIVVAILCVIMLVYSVVDSMGILDRNTTAMTVGEDEINVSELNMYYQTVRSNFLSQYSDILLMYGYDYTSPSFDAMACLMDSTMTWKQYFMEEAKSSAEEISVLYQEAQKAGYEMTDYDQTQFDAYFTQLTKAANEAGVNEAKYLKMIYGNGVDRAAVEEYYGKRCLAAGYYETVVDGFGINDAMANDYYVLHQSEYDLVEYYSYNVAFDVVTFTEGSTEEGAPKNTQEAEALTQANMDAAKAEAEHMLSELKADGSNFDETVKQHLEEGVTYGTGRKEHTLAEAANVIQTWLKMEGREAGDMEMLLDETNKAYVVVVYLGTHPNTETTKSVRHTLLTTETAASDATDAEKAEIEAKNAEVKAQAEALYEEWKAAGATEEGFIEMAREHTADSNGANGGLYTGVYMGQMVEAFENWCFDESRQPGDHGIVETSYGYHIMYFVEDEGLKFMSDIKALLESEKYNEYLTAQTEAYDITYNNSAIDRM